MLQAAFKKMSPGSKVILALDNDEGGDTLAEKLTAIFRDSGLAEVNLVPDRQS